MAGAAFVWVASGNRAPQASLQGVPLTSFRGDECYTAFSPDGSQVAFSWNGEKQDNYDIYVMLIGSDRLLRLHDRPCGRSGSVVVARRENDRVCAPGGGQAEIHDNPGAWRACSGDCGITGAALPQQSIPESAFDRLVAGWPLTSG